MFVKAKVISGLLAVMGVLGLGYYTLHLSEVDQALFLSQGAKGKTVMPQTEQVKEGVQKDLYFGEEHTCLESPRSVVKTTPDGELVEEMEDIDCVIEDGHGECRKMHSKTGTYFYQDQMFVSQRVHMERFQDGRKELDGIAKEVCVRFDGLGPKIEAEQVRARVGGKR